VTWVLTLAVLVVGTALTLRSVASLEREVAELQRTGRRLRDVRVSTARLRRRQRQLRDLAAGVGRSERLGTPR
jgi:hypothetical protein